MTDRRVAAILVAAGAGLRLGHDVPKAFVTIRGRTLLEHAADRFREHAVVLVVVAPADQLDHAAALVPSATVVAGGATRQQSVARGLAAVGDSAIVLVHDVARPFVPNAVIERVVAAVAAGSDAVVPVLPVTDTLRSLDGGAVDRSRVRAVQTPQGFRVDVLRAAHAVGGDTATDDATLAEAAGYAVTTVDGAPEAFKITTAFDLVLAEAVGR